MHPDSLGPLPPCRITKAINPGLLTLGCLALFAGCVLVGLLLGQSRDKYQEHLQAAAAAMWAQRAEQGDQCTVIGDFEPTDSHGMHWPNDELIAACTARARADGWRLAERYARTLVFIRVQPAQPMPSPTHPPE